MKIRITAAGVGTVINQRSDWPEGTVLTVPTQDGNYFINNGFGELAKDAPKEEEAVIKDEPILETATAEPAEETATEARPPRRKGGF